MNTLNLQQITIQSFPTTSAHETYLMEVAGRFFEIGKDTARILIYFQQNGCGEEAIEAYVANTAGKYSKDEIEIFLDNLSKKMDGDKSMPDKRKAFLYNKAFLPETVINKCSVWLKFLFHRRIMIPSLLLFTVLDILYFVDFQGIGKERLDMNIYLLAGLFLFFVFSSLFHELGHASACRYFGVAHGDIGFGLYINIPVFYTDVSNVWKLPRKQRCIVNIGGVYFQTLLLIPFLIAGVGIESSLLNYIILIMNLNFLLTLNPFFRFDGYWMMTDILGVANLRQKGKEWMNYMWKILLRKETGKRPYLFSLTKDAKIGLVIYTVVVNLFFGFYFFYALPQFFIRFYQTFPERFDRLLVELSMRKMPDWMNLQQIVLQLFFLFFFLYMLYKMLVPVIRKWVK